MKNFNNSGTKVITNTLSIIILIFIFGGLIYVVNAAYSQKINDTRDLLERQTSTGISTIGPVSVDHSVCHYLLPNSQLDSFLGFVLCPGCVAQASWINSNFKVVLVGSNCAQRGSNTMRFIRLAQPLNK
jgi:hypothetical protein